MILIFKSKFFVCVEVYLCVLGYLYMLFLEFYLFFWKKLLRDKVDFKINFFFNVVVIIELNENEEN